MPVESTQRSYIALRSDAIQEADKHAGGRSKNFRRRTGGTAIYLHDSKTNKISSLWPWRIPQRMEKRKSGANDIKASINRQFPNVQDRNGKQVKVGDIVFRNLKNPRKISANDFQKIDREIAKVLRSQVRFNPAAAAEMKAVATNFEAASTGHLSAKQLTRVEENLRQAAGFRNAIRSDAILSGQSPIVATRIAESTIKHLRAAGHDVNLGVTMAAIDCADTWLQGLNISGPNLKDVQHSKHLQLKAQHITPQINEALDKLETILSNMQYSNDPLVAETTKFVRASQKLQKHAAGLPRNQYVQHTTEQLAEGKALLAKLEASHGWPKELAPQLGELLGGVNELHVAAMPRRLRTDLARRPMATPPQTLNVASDLHTLQSPAFGAGHRATPRLVHGRKATTHTNQIQSRIETQCGQYDAALTEVDAALRAFQADGSDAKLGVLMTKIDKANLASDYYLKALGMAGRVPRRLTSKSVKPRLQAIRRKVATQRRMLQELGRKAGTVNDQRNAIAHNGNLPAAHMRDRQAGANRRAAHIANAKQGMPMSPPPPPMPKAPQQQPFQQQPFQQQPFQQPPFQQQAPDDPNAIWNRPLPDVIPEPNVNLNNMNTLGNQALPEEIPEPDIIIGNTNGDDGESEVSESDESLMIEITPEFDDMDWDQLDGRRAVQQNQTPGIDDPSFFAGAEEDIDEDDDIPPGGNDGIGFKPGPQSHLQMPGDIHSEDNEDANSEPEGMNLQGKQTPGNDDDYNGIPMPVRDTPGNNGPQQLNEMQNDSEEDELDSDVDDNEVMLEGRPHQETMGVENDMEVLGDEDATPMDNDSVYSQ